MMNLQYFFGSKKRRRDHTLIVIWPLVAVLLTYLLETFGVLHENFFFSIIVFMAVPSLFLAYRAPQYVKKILIPTCLIGVPLMIVIEYIGYSSLAWSFPPSIFPFTLFSHVIIEVPIWLFFNVFYILMYYEYFLDHHITHRLWQPELKYLVQIAFTVFLAFSIFALTGKEVFVPYFYLVFGTVLLIAPMFIILSKMHPSRRLTFKILQTTAYFAYVSMAYELVALHFNHWSFNSNQFIGWIQLFQFSFPLEELLIWIIFLAPSMVVYYEYFDDDRK